MLISSILIVVQSGENYRRNHLVKVNNTAKFRPAKSPCTRRLFSIVFVIIGGILNLANFDLQKFEFLSLQTDFFRDNSHPIEIL